MNDIFDGSVNPTLFEKDRVELISGTVMSFSKSRRSVDTVYKYFVCAYIWPSSTINDIHRMKI